MTKQFSEAHIYCGICGEETNDRKKRKLLRGKAGEAYCEIILDFVASTDDWIVCEVNTCMNRLPQNRQYICSTCQSVTAKWRDLQRQTMEQQAIMYSKIAALMHKDRPREQSQQAPSSKRQPLPHSLIPKRLKWGNMGSPEVVVSQNI